MNHVQLIQRELSSLFSVTEGDGFVRVVTQNMYPSNGFVQVFVRGGERTFVVSDEGGAIQQIRSAGAEIKSFDNMVRPMLDQFGLNIANGVIRSPACDADRIAYCIAVVSNASKAAADWLYSRVRVKPHDNFKQVVSHFLNSTFENVRHEVIIGKSNKPHKFDNIIHLDNGKRIIVDAVVPDANSINARFAANIDVRSAGLSDIEQRIVYDDNDDWALADLNLLQAGATLIKYSKAPEAIRRLAS